MSECPETHILERYHDGELAPDAAAAIERHLAGCDRCARELRQLREMSVMLAGSRPEPIRPAELTRVHQAVDERGDSGVLRLAVGLVATAASVLIISGVWLYTAPSPVSPAAAGTPDPAWARMAEGSYSEPPPGAPDVGVAARDTADWMISGVAER